MMHTHEHLFKRLEVVEAMCAFISYHLGGVEELRSRLEEEKGFIRAEADTLKREKEALEGQFNGVEQENLQLKKEVDELRASLAA